MVLPILKNLDTQKTVKDFGEISQYYIKTNSETKNTQEIFHKIMVSLQCFPPSWSCDVGSLCAAKLISHPEKITTFNN